MSNIHSCAYLSPVCILLYNICSCLFFPDFLTGLPVFFSLLNFIVVDTSPRYWFFVRYMVFIYFLLICSLSFHSLNKGNISISFHRAKVSNLDEGQFMDYAFGVKTKTSLPTPR